MRLTLQTEYTSIWSLFAIHFSPQLWRMTQLPNPIRMVVRFRMDAALYEPGPPHPARRKGRPRKKGQR